MGLRLLAHRLEQPRHFQLRFHAGDSVPQGQACQVFLAQQSGHYRVHAQCDVFPLGQGLRQDGVTPELVPPVDYRHVAAQVREEQGVLQGGVAAAGNGCVLPGVEGPIAHGTVGDARQGLLPGQAQ